MQGQAAHFHRYAPTKIQYAIDRYANETRRLYRVLDTQLAQSKSGFLVGDHVSVADVAALSWVIYGGYVNVTLDEFAALKKWEAMMSDRPGISKGFHVPKPLVLKQKGQDAETIEKAMDQQAKKASEWILKGMEQDKKD